jgi:hypothetical protein
LVARPAIVAMTLVPLFRRTFPAVLPSVPLGRILLANATLAGICLFTGRQRIMPALIVASIGIGIYGVALLACRVFPISAVTRLFTQTLDSSFSVMAERWRLRLHSPRA